MTLLSTDIKTNCQEIQNKSQKRKVSFKISVSLGAEVEVMKVEIIVPSEPQHNVELDFSNSAQGDKKAVQFNLKEKAVYNIRVTFKVHHDIVYGLKFVNLVRKGGKIVDKYEEVIGSYAPKEELHVFNLPGEEAPSGFFMRGKYIGKSLIVDNDGFVHVQFEYPFEIKKKWN